MFKRTAIVATVVHSGDSLCIKVCGDHELEILKAILLFYIESILCY